MKKTLTFSLLLFFLGFFATTNLHAVNKAPLRAKVHRTTSHNTSLDRKTIEQKIQRKLTFRERIALRIFQKKQKSQKGTTDIMSIIGLSASLLSVVGLFVSPIIWIVFSIAGIIFGAIGMARTKKNPELKGRGMAIAGLILGIISLILPFLLLGAILSAA